MANETPDEAATEKPAAPKKKLSMLQIGLLAQVVIMLGAGVLIVKASLFKPKPDLRIETLKEKAILSVKENMEKAEIVDLEEFTVNLSEKHTLKTHIQLEVSDRSVTEQLQRRKPAVRAMIMNMLTSVNPQQIDKFEGKLLLKDAIRESLNKEIHEDSHAAEEGLRAPASVTHEASAEGIVREIYLVDFILI